MLHLKPSVRSALPKAAQTAAATAAVVLLATACSPAGQPEATEPVSGGNLVYASGDAEPTCLDPHVGGNYPQALAATQFLEQLVSRDAEGQIIPWLATGWEESPDGLSWTFRLREDVSFTDGTPLNAAAVQANIEHVKDPATASSTGFLALGKVTGTEIVDEHTIMFNLSQPDSALLESLTQPWLAIQSAAALERPPAENCAAPVGTGPFKVESWVKQDAITFTRNENYASAPADAAHQGPAYLESITWRFIPESASRYAALQSGEVDVIDNAQPDTLAAAGQNDSLVELNAPRPGASNRIELNSGQAPFDDPLVREAFIRSADVDSAIEGLFFGTAPRSHSALSSIEKLGYADPGLFRYDPEEAKRLLDEAGWTETDSEGYRVKDGKRLTVDFPVSTNQSIPAEQSLFEQIQATAKETGFEVRLHPMDLSSWYSTLGASEYNLVSAPYSKVGPDVLRILYHSSGTIPAPSGYFANLSKLRNPQLDTLLEEAARETDETRRADLYGQAQKMILEGYYILPLYDQQNHYLHRAEVQGMRAIPHVSTPSFHDAWLSS